MSTPDLAAEKPFEFDLKQRNTLNKSGLAAYVQRPPRDRVGWVYVRQVWLPGWQPAKWAYQVQRLEVTLESFWTVEDYEAQAFDFEPWDILMLTAYETFLTDEIRQVERFFALFTDKAEFAQHPDKVQCPHEYANEELSAETPARYSLIRRKWAALLLCLQHTGRLIILQKLNEQLQGQIGAVERSHFELVTNKGLKWLSFSERHGARLYTIHEDGYVQSLWHEPTAREALDPSTLPIWDFNLNQWVMLEQAGADE